MIALIAFLKVEIYFVRKEMAEHKENCQRSTDKNKSTWVRVDSTIIENIRSLSIRKRNNNTEKTNDRDKIKQVKFLIDLIHQHLMSFTQSKC